MAGSVNKPNITIVGKNVVYTPTFGMGDMQYTVQKVLQFRNNIYSRSLYLKHSNLILTGKPVISIFNPDNEVEEETQLRVEKMLRTIKLESNILPTIISDHFWWGISIWNPVWEKVDGEYTIAEMRHLPSQSFGQASGGGKVYSKLLRGITYDESGELVFNQSLDGGGIEKLNSEGLFWIRNGVSEDPGGDAMILPLIPILDMMIFSWNTLMQVENREGAPIFFIKITNPREACDENGNVSDIDYANMIMEGWGKDTAFVIRDNMEIVNLSVTGSDISGRVIELLNNLMISYFTPSSLITKSGGSLIGGSAAAEYRLLAAYIQSLQMSVEVKIAELIDQYLMYNGYEGYHAEVDLPVPSSTDKTIDMQIANLMASRELGYPNEIRNLLGVEGVDEDELYEFYKARQTAPTMGVPEMFTSKDELTVEDIIKKTERRLELLDKKTERKLKSLVR